MRKLAVIVLAVLAILMAACGDAASDPIEQNRPDDDSAVEQPSLISEEPEPSPEAEPADNPQPERELTEEERLAEAYMAYYEILKSAVGEHGIGEKSGVSHAELIDFDSDGIPELLYVVFDHGYYEDPEGLYWGSQHDYFVHGYTDKNVMLASDNIVRFGSTHDEIRVLENREGILYLEYYSFDHGSTLNRLSMVENSELFVALERFYDNWSHMFLESDMYLEPDYDENSSDECGCYYNVNNNPVSEEEYYNALDELAIVSEREIVNDPDTVLAVLSELEAITGFAPQGSGETPVSEFEYRAISGGMEITKYTGRSITWEECALREYLNERFYKTAFTSAEQARIIETEVVNSDNPHSRASGGIDTTDKVFLLSVDEANRYFTGYSARIAINAEGREAWWWLRSPGYYDHFAAYVEYNGDINNHPDNVTSFASNESGGVRPALWMSF